MKGFRYLSDTINITDCKNIEDEVCNGGPNVWIPLRSALNCTKPCEIINYRGSIIQYKNENTSFDEAQFWIETGSSRTVGKELLVYDTNDMIGSIGGSLGLFLGFSFFGIISTIIDKLLEIYTKLQQKDQMRIILE